MKNLFLILVAMCAVACSGESFETAEFDAVAGDAPVTAGTGGASTATGGAAAGGRPVTAGAPATAGTPNGGASAGAAAGGSSGAPQCDLDPTLIASVLPKQIVWQDAMQASGEECIKCRDATCVTINVESWGTPIDNGDGSYTFVPNADRPMVPFSVGKNDGMCTEDHVCGIKIYDLAVTVYVAQGAVVKTKVQPYFQTNTCATAPATFADDMSAEFTKATNGLKIPCDS